MSFENDREELDREFERLRMSGRVARDPGGVGFDVESLPDFFNNVAHLWDAKFAVDCAQLRVATVGFGRPKRGATHIDVARLEPCATAPG